MAAAEALVVHADRTRVVDGIAILAGRPPAPGNTDDVRMARRRGYAVTVGAIQPGAVGVAAPIRVSDWATVSLGVVQQA